MIFVSHSKKDEARLRPLVDELKARGLGVRFAPDDLELGFSVTRWMNEGLDESDRLLVAWSANSSSSEFALEELYAFYKANPQPGPILFLRLDGTRIPTLFNDRVYFRATGDNAHDAAVIADWASGRRNREIVSKRGGTARHRADSVNGGSGGGGSKKRGARPRQHPLHDYPRGPLVELHRVTGALVRAFATLLDTRSAAHTLIQEANRFRLEADHGDPSVTIIGLEYLPSFEVGAYSFWQSALYEACRHGPRMLAALLLSQPDAQLPQEARRDRARLLEHLRGMRPAEE